MPQARNNLHKSKFLALEFVFYYIVIAACAAKLVAALWTCTRLFQPGGRWQGTFYIYKGWIPGLHNDLSDIQWRLYRESLPALAGALTFWVTASVLVRRCAPGWHNAFATLSGAALLFVLHGWQALHVLAILLAFHWVCQRTAGQPWLGPVSFWVLPAAVWLLARLYDGIPFARLSPALAGMDAHRGLMRWQIGFNLVILRMISWAFDLHWTRMRRTGFPVGFETSAPSRAYDDPPQSFLALSPKERQLVHHLEPSYAAAPFLRYCLYPPLYLTGPTITFNDFVCQSRCSKPTQVSALVRYGARVLLSLLLLEVLTHTLYVNAFLRFKPWERLGSAADDVFPPLVLAGAAFFKLIFLWLKFTVIWRVARFFALADGVDPPENMTRCVCNNYDISGFWRNWHASYNRWLVRYMYIPMGGNRWRMLNVWPIFTFVAIWHDLEPHLLRWAWLMALFVALEVLCKSVISRPRWRVCWDAAWFNHLCAAFAAAYITVMMAVNLIGYGVGSHGILHLLQRVAGSTTLTAGMLASFYSAAHIMFEIRRAERAALTRCSRSM